MGRLRGTMPRIGGDAVASLAPWADEFDRLADGERFSAADFIAWCRLEVLGPDPRGERFTEQCEAGHRRQLPATG